MKKFFNRILQSLKTSLKNFKRKLQATWERFIFLQYKRMRRKRSFVQKIYHHHVKKGDDHYTLLIVKTSFGKLIWNLGRNGMNELESQGTPLNERMMLRRTR